MKKILSLLALLMLTVTTAWADSWTVAGSSAALNGSSDWDPTNADNDMTLVSGSDFVLEVTNCTLEQGTTYEFKVVKNHNWVEGSFPASNKSFTVAETAVYTVTYSFNANTEEVEVSTEKTGEAGPISHTYTVAGSSEVLFDTAWTPANTDNDMVLEDGVYKWEKNGVELTAETIYFKVTVDHAWGEAYPASNYELKIDASGMYNIEITFNADSKEVTATATEVPKTITSVTLMGSSNEWSEPLAEFSEDPSTGYWTANNVNFAKNDKFKVRVNYNYGTPKWLSPESDGDFLVDEKQLNKALTVLEGQPDMYVNHAMKLSFSMNPAVTELTITCNDVYTIAGTKSLTGTENDWDIVDSNNMVLNGETGLYEWTVDNIVVSTDNTYDYKVVKNGTAWIPTDGNKEITLANIGAAVAGKYNIKITFNAGSEVISSTGDKTHEAVTISNEKGWATTVTNSALDFSGESFNAYTATLDGTTVTLNEVSDVPAETGLVLKGDPDTYYVPVIENSETPKGSLSGSSTYSYNVDDSYKHCFGLTIKNEMAQFVKIQNGVTISAKKAFLETAPSLARELTVVFEGETTGIETVNAEQATLKGEMYNLAGQKVNKSFKGIVINNGKKVMMK